MAAVILKDPRAWFAAGRIKACSLMPYFSTAVMGLVPYEMPGFGTLGVTARAVLIWDPDLSKKWTVEQLAWVLLHEVGHYLREHSARRERLGADPDLWNIAGDAEINDDLVAAGAQFPVLEAGDGVPPELVGKPGGITPKLIGCSDGKLCEEYYEHLRQKQRSGKGGSGQGEGQGIAGLPPPGGTSKGCGSGAGKPVSEAEQQVPAHLGKSAAEQKRIQRSVAEAVRKEAAKGRGTLPAGLRRWAEEVLGTPQVPWQQTLARLVRNAVAFRPGAGDYRYDRPSRRQGAFGYGPGSPVFPALRQPVPSVSVIVDTSGSMGGGDLLVALEETKGVLAAVGANATFIACDAAVHEVKRVRTVKEAAALLKGGGGTDMRPAIEAAQQGRPRPEVIVVMTDGDIGDPGPAPAANVVWVCIGKSGGFSPAFGQVVFVETAGKRAA